MPLINCTVNDALVSATMPRHTCTSFHWYYTTMTKIATGPAVDHTGVRKVRYGRVNRELLVRKVIQWRMLSVQSLCGYVQRAHFTSSTL